MTHPTSQERRQKTRSKIPRMIRVRPSEPTAEEFDEILPTINASRNSVYFVPQNGVFELKRRVFITFPSASDPGAINQEFLGQVTRVDVLPGNKQAVAVDAVASFSVVTKDAIR